MIVPVDLHAESVLELFQLQVRQKVTLREVRKKNVGIKLHDLGNLACVRCILRVVYVSKFCKGACVCGFV